MSPKRLKLEQALEILPQTASLAPLRDALVDGSRPDADKQWAGSQEYLTLEQRLVDADELERRIPELAERVRARAERVYRHALAALRAGESRNWVRAARELISAGEVEEAARHFGPAERLYDRARELGRRPRDRSVEGLALRRLGRVARSTGDRERALRLYREGHAVAEAQRDLSGMVVACQGIGNVLGDQGRWEEARRWYERGLELLDDGAPSTQLWELCANLATVERHAGDLRRARHWLDRAEAAIRALGAENGIFFLENNRGLLLREEGDSAAAEAAFREALAHTDDPYLRTVGLLNVAESLLPRGLAREAASVAREAERIAIAAGVVGELAAVYRVLGAAAGASNDPEAFLFFEEALAVCRRYELPAVEHALTQHAYGRWEARRGDPDAARARLEESVRELEALGARADAAAAQRDLAALDQPSDG